MSSSSGGGGGSFGSIRSRSSASIVVTAIASVVATATAAVQQERLLVERLAIVPAAVECRPPISVPIRQTPQQRRRFAPSPSEVHPHCAPLRPWRQRQVCALLSVHKPGGGGTHLASGRGGGIHGLHSLRSQLA